MARKKKTISIEKMVTKANAELLFRSHGDDADKHIALSQWETIKSMLMSFDGYAGYNYMNHRLDVERTLRKFVDMEIEDNGCCVYGERDIEKVMRSFEAERKRIADIWYIETGNDYDSMFPDGQPNNAGEWSEWIQFSNGYFNDENFIFLY